MYSIIVAIGKNFEIGKNNKLLWSIPEDLKKFKEITTGKVVVMGRKTYESIGRPLPNRKNIILSRNLTSEDLKLKDNNDVEIYSDLEEVLNKYKDYSEEIFIIGGEQIYKEVINKNIVEKYYISHINIEDDGADAYFPKINFENFEKIKEENYEKWKFCIYKK